jgi:hypothetical protein
VKCSAWEFDESNFVRERHYEDDLERLKFEDGDTILDVKSYFVIDDYI